MRSSTVSFAIDAVHDDRLVLADAVRAIGGLLFDGRVPPRVEQEHVPRRP
jgi:hypothetical protein